WRAAPPGRRQGQPDRARSTPGDRFSTGSQRHLPSLRGLGLSAGRCRWLSCAGSPTPTPNLGPRTMAWTRFGKTKDMPGGLWSKCEYCGAMLFRKEYEQKRRVCGTCGYHFTLPGRDRVTLTVDQGTFQELWADLRPEDRLGFNDRVPYS